MFDLVLFIGGMMVAWAVLAVFCAERQRRIMAIHDRIERERYAAAEAQRKARQAASASARGDVVGMLEPAERQPPKAKAA